MAEKFHRWDAADHLKTEEDITLYFETCLEEDPGDGSLVRVALGDIARARSMTKLAQDGNFTRGLVSRLERGRKP